METNQHLIQVQKTARYHALENNSEIKKIWIVCHGYGYLSQYFIKKFEGLNVPGTLIIAPEGFSKFYLEGLNGKVGASWMTSDNRKIDIQDNIAYLNTLYDHLIATYGQVEINVLGFSQAACTVCYWLNDAYAKINQLVLWAGMFPADMDYEINKEIYDPIDVHWVVGNKDHLINSEKVNEHNAILINAGIKFKHHTFQGGHNINEEALLRWFI